MIRINRLTLPFLLAFATTWCSAQNPDSSSQSSSHPFPKNLFLTTITIPEPKNSETATTAVTHDAPAVVDPAVVPAVRLFESSLLLPPETGTASVGADSYLSSSDAKTESLTEKTFSVFHDTNDEADAGLEIGHLQSPTLPTSTLPLPTLATSTPPTSTEQAGPVQAGPVQALFNDHLSEAEESSTYFSNLDLVNFQNVDGFNMPLDAPIMASSAAYGTSGVNSVAQFNVGVDLYAAPNFKNGLLIYGKNVAMKIGGYVKADFIYDFDPIDSTDSFDTTQIPVDALPRTNSRFHARQSRLSFDTRWKGGGDIVKIYVEGDFFSTNDTFRLRQAYGESGRLLVGKTWTAFTDVAAAPATLDFEGSVSSVNRRQAQARYTFPICDDLVTGTLSLEDTRFIISLDPSLGTPRSPSPDFVGHIRLATDLIQLQAAALYREVGFQPVGQSTVTRSAGGMNFTGVLMLTGRTKAYSQVLFGRGIGSYRSLPDAAEVTGGEAALLPMFGWMFGLTHEWTDLLSSNFTYAANDIDNTSGQDADAIKQTTYMAINLLAKPQDRITVGIEYLYGTRTDKDLQSAGAHRVQCAMIFDLP